MFFFLTEHHKTYSQRTEAAAVLMHGHQSIDVFVTLMATAGPWIASGRWRAWRMHGTSGRFTGGCCCRRSRRHRRGGRDCCNAICRTTSSVSTDDRRMIANITASR